MLFTDWLTQQHILLGTYITTFYHSIFSQDLMSMKMFCKLNIHCFLLVIFADFGATCDGVLPLSHIDMRARNYKVDTSEETLLDDSYLNAGWFSVGSYLMPDSTLMPMYGTCGSINVIYNKGTNPDISKLTENPIPVTACLTDGFESCIEQYSISMRKCGHDLQYFLISTSRRSAYCFDPEELQSESAFSPPPDNVNFGNVEVRTRLEHDTTQNGDNVKFTPRLEFECSFNWEDDYHYDVYWYVRQEGRPLLSIGPYKSNKKSEGILHEATLLNNEIKMGFMIKCGVRARLGNNGMGTPMTISGETFAGIKKQRQVINGISQSGECRSADYKFCRHEFEFGFIRMIRYETAIGLSIYTTPLFGDDTIYVVSHGHPIEHQVTMSKNSTGTIRYVITVPIGCNYVYPFVSDRCIINLEMFLPNDDTCQTEGGLTNLANTDTCGQHIQTAKSQADWDANRVYEFNVTTVDRSYSDKTIYNVMLQVEDNWDTHAIWNKSRPDSVTVHVLDDNKYINKVCYSHVDPHMKTSDGRTYENQNSGTYILYRNTEYPIEVQEKLQRCNRHAWCACAVAIRAGGDLFIINRCDRSNAFSTFTSCENNGILRVIEYTNSFKIYTPIGTIVLVTFIKRYPGSMNIDITMSAKDIGNTVGLCGYFDGDSLNDFKHRPGAGGGFTSSWRVTAEEDLFTERKLMQWVDMGGQLYCTCNNENKPNNNAQFTEANCSATQYVSCSMGTAYPKKKCEKINHKKRSLHLKYRRENSRLLRILNDVTDVDEPDITKEFISTHRTRDSNELRKTCRDVTSNMTESDARTICNDVIMGSLAVREFSEHTAGEDPADVIEQCVFDVQLGNDASLARVHEESLNQIVKTMFEKDIEYVESQPDTVQYFKKNTCSFNCSDVGTCTEEGTCLCNEYYHGADCGIDERVPVEITDMEGEGTCNLTDGDGCTCFYFRTLDLLPNFLCHVSGERTYTSNATEPLPVTVVTGEQEDIFTGICCIPDASRIRRSAEHENVFTTRYDISVSNDGIHAGASRSMLVFDSTCQDLRHEENDIVVELKDGFCFIERLCIKDGDTKLPDQRFVCLVTRDRYRWTLIEEDKQEEANTGLIVGLTVGLTLGMSTLVVAAVLIKTKLVPRMKQRKSVGDSFVHIHSSEK